MKGWRYLQARALCRVAQVLSRFGEAHVWLVFHMDLRRPIAPASAAVPVAIGQATAADAPEMAAMWSADEPLGRSARVEAEIFRSRFRAGSLCYVARVEGRIVAYDWIRLYSAAGPARIEMALADDEVYTTNAYTAAAFRGCRIHPALNHAILRRAQDDGYRIAYTMARADNSRSLPTLRRMGWTLSGALLVYEPRRAPDMLRWLVLGSPYPMPVGPLASTRAPRLAEFHAQQGFDGQEALPSPPFANHCRLKRGSERFRLTIVPAEHAAGLRVAAAVARTWPAAAWPVAACNHVFESWMLTREPDDASPGTEPVSMLDLLKAYAALQATAARQGERLRMLPVAPLDDLVGRLLSFLERDHEPDAPDAGEVGAAFFLGAQQAAQLHRALHPHRQALTQHLQACTRLPLTLNHGDLQAPDAAAWADGSCRMPDWIWASAGPAGLSLHGLVGSQIPLYALLPAGTDREDADETGEPGALLAHYRQGLVQGGYASEAALRTALPATLTAGLMLDILRMADYPLDDPEPRAQIALRLQSRLAVLVHCCQRLPPAVQPGADLPP